MNAQEQQLDSNADAQETFAVLRAASALSAIKVFFRTRFLHNSRTG